MEWKRMNRPVPNRPCVCMNRTHAVSNLCGQAVAIKWPINGAVGYQSLVNHWSSHGQAFANHLLLNYQSMATQWSITCRSTVDPWPTRGH